MLLDNALQYAGRGWFVLPLFPVVVSATTDGIEAYSCGCGKQNCTSPGKHPVGRLVPRGARDASCDPKVIEAWWSAYPTANIGIATGPSKLAIADIDGEEGKAQFLCELAPLEETLTAVTGRGFHLYYSDPEGKVASSQVKGEHLDTRGTTGYVVAPGSTHIKGVEYKWLDNTVPLALVPEKLVLWQRRRAGGNAPSGGIGKAPLIFRKEVTGNNQPDRREPGLEPLTAKTVHQPQTLPRRTGDTPRLSAGARLKKIAEEGPPWSEAEEHRLRDALSVIPADLDGRTWFSFGAAIHDLRWIIRWTIDENGENSDSYIDRGFEIWNDWSSTSKGKGAGAGEYKGRADLEKRWRHFEREYNGIRATLGTIYKEALKRGWKYRGYPAGQERNQESVNNSKNNDINGAHSAFAQDLGSESSDPRIELNKHFAVIEDIGGKCMVASWVPSRVDQQYKVISLQSFDTFKQRFCNQYLNEKPLGKKWLDWPGRASYTGLDLVPEGDPVLPDGTLNLWQGFAFEPREGDWSLMQAHIYDVLAGGNADHARYIYGYLAWTIQNPGERAGVALVLRGGEGAGKGTLGNAVCRLFGGHGLHITHSRHLTGHFNASLRYCLFLFADEAFWAGDKQGEGTFKGLITEPSILIEHKGLDPVPCRNRLHILMTANSEWVVPARHDARRYAVFDVAEHRARDLAYFAAIESELNSGGYEAMLYDLQHADLGDFHPRRIPNTEALRKQKELSMDWRDQWWEATLQKGKLPFMDKSAPDTAPFKNLFDQAKEYNQWGKASFMGLGIYLRDNLNTEKNHTEGGQVYSFPKLAKCRSDWETKMRGWKWDLDIPEWRSD